jgi:hypothetical protein
MAAAWRIPRKQRCRRADRRAHVRALLLVITPLCLALQPFDSSAQTVRGVVHEHETGGPVVDAAVTFTRHAAAGDVVVASTDSSGVFAARLPTAGEYEVAVRHAGHRPVTQRIDVAGGQEVVLEIRLSPVVLEPIRVVARRRDTRGGLGDYYDRLELYGRLGIGRFVTREQIERMGAFGNPASFLSTVPFVRVDGTVVLAPVFRHRGRDCYPRLFYDGVLVDAGHLADLSANLEGIEVYRGHAQSPGVYDDPNGCGVVLFWSRPDRDGGGVRWLSGRRGVLAIGALLLGGYLVMR